MGERNSWVIEGKRYNLETATKVASYNNLSRGADSTTDFGYYEKTLYLTPKSNWFLTGSGGIATIYSRSCGCTPISEDEAREQLEAWEEYDLLEKYFSDTLEDT
jgi:hypothetical protein